MSDTPLDIAVDRIVELEAKLAAANRDIKFLLSFAPNGSTPKGLDPTFYHTLTYEGDVKLQERINAIDAAKGE